MGCLKKKHFLIVVKFHREVQQVKEVIVVSVDKTVEKELRCTEIIVIAFSKLMLHVYQVQSSTCSDIRPYVDVI